MLGAEMNRNTNSKYYKCRNEKMQICMKQGA